jgi:hypothetical protein
MTNRGHHCEPKAKQSRGEPQQTKRINRLPFPTFAKCPIESQWIFSRLSHRLWQLEAWEASDKAFIEPSTVAFERSA